MKKTVKITALILALLMLLASFASCSDDGGSDTDNTVDTTKTGEERFTGVDFKGNTITLCMSSCKDSERVGASAHKYMTGIEDDGTVNMSDSIVKTVIDRNTYVTQKLNLTVEYNYIDDSYNTMVDTIESKYNAHDGFADAISNQSYGLIRCMMKGIFNNVNTTDKTNYFDLTDKTWYKDSIEAFAFGNKIDGKVYILAGDYYIDLLRCIETILVNEQVLITSEGSSDAPKELYERIEEGDWTYDYLIAMTKRAYKDNGTRAGEADENDSLGLLMLNGMDFTHSADIDYIVDNGGTLSYTNNRNKLSKLVDIGVTLIGTKGVLVTKDYGTRRNVFAKGNTLFMGAARLYELENTLYDKLALCPIPYPKVETEDKYVAYIHDMASVGAIFKTGDFAACSAYIQYSNILSEKTRIKYYEDGLGLKYETGTNTKAMLTILYENMTVSPDFVIDHFMHALSEYKDATPIWSMVNASVTAGNNTLESTWNTLATLKANGLAEIIKEYNEIDK